MPNLLAQMVARTVPYHIDRLSLICREAVRRRRRASCAADICTGVEAAGTRIIEVTIRHPTSVLNLAGRDRRVARGGVLTGCQRLTLGDKQILEHQPRPGIREPKFVVKERGRADEEAIELVAIVASERETLPPPCRAAVPVVARRPGVVIVQRDELGPLDLLVNAFDDVIDDLSAIELIRRLNDAECSARSVLGTSVTAIGR